MECDRWKLIASRLPCGPKGLTSLNLRKHMIEHYVTVKQVIINSIALGRTQYCIPLRSINVVIAKSSSMEFLGIRVSMNVSGLDKSINLGVREFNPTPDERMSDKAFDILVKWLRAVLIEFNIDLNQVLTSSIDSGSDIKRVLEIVFKILREWCVSHLINLSLVDAFGTCVDKKKSKNIRVREIFTRVRRFIEYVNKSGLFKALLNQNIHEKFGRFLKLCNSPQHRWFAMEDVLSSLLCLWDSCITTYSNMGLDFPLVDLKVVLIEMFSFIRPIRNIRKTSSINAKVCSNRCLYTYGLFTIQSVRSLFSSQNS